MLIHIEVQGYNDPDFSRRMFHYFYRILDRYGVPATAIAIYTDSNPAFHPTHYTYDFAGTQYTYRFNTYKVLEQDEAELSASNNPFAIAILTVLLDLKKKRRRLDDNNLYPLKMGLVRRLYAHGFPKKIILHLSRFLESYVNFASPETEVRFDREIKQITVNQPDMTTIEIAMQLEKERSLEQGKTERNTFFVESLLRSTDFKDEKIAALAGVTLEFVHEIKGKMQ